MPIEQFRSLLSNFCFAIFYSFVNVSSQSNVLLKYVILIKIYNKFVSTHKGIIIFTKLYKKNIHRKH